MLCLHSPASHTHIHKHTRFAFVASKHNFFSDMLYFLLLLLFTFWAVSAPHVLTPFCERNEWWCESWKSCCIFFLNIICFYCHSANFFQLALIDTAPHNARIWDASVSLVRLIRDVSATFPFITNNGAFAMDILLWVNTCSLHENSSWSAHGCDSPNRMLLGFYMRKKPLGEMFELHEICSDTFLHIFVLKSDKISNSNPKFVSARIHPGRKVAHKKRVERREQMGVDQAHWNWMKIASLFSKVCYTFLFELPVKPAMHNATRPYNVCSMFCFKYTHFSQPNGSKEKNRCFFVLFCLSSTLCTTFRQI